MTGPDELRMLSECCAAEPTDELSNEDQGICGRCHDNAVFTREDK